VLWTVHALQGVIVLAATNLPETLDPALKRPGRFDRQVAVPLPDVKGRAEVLGHYLKDKPVAPGLDTVRVLMMIMQSWSQYNILRYGCCCAGDMLGRDPGLDTVRVDTGSVCACVLGGCRAGNLLLHHRPWRIVQTPGCLVQHVLGA
jgi:hypothetical protein